MDWKFGQGLTWPEIREALSCTGAIVYAQLPLKGNMASPQSRMRLLTYTFVESGVPAILCYKTSSEAHAVTLVGHLLPTDQVNTDECDACLVYTNYQQKNRHYFVGLSTQLYYAHNDAYGPYDRVQIVSTSTMGPKMRAQATHLGIKLDSSCLVAIGQQGRHVGALSALLVPLPSYVQNHPEHILFDALMRFDTWFPKSPNVRVLWRCLLVNTSDFKASLVTRKFNVELRSRYLQTHLPMYVWLVEFTLVPPDCDMPFVPNRMIDGEFLYDSTTPYYEPCCLLMRIGSKFRDCRADTEFHSIKAPDQPYLCFVHSAQATL